MTVRRYGTKRTGRPKSACWSKSSHGPVLILTALKPLLPGLPCGRPTFPHCFRNTFAGCGRHPTSFLRSTRCWFVCGSRRTPAASDRSGTAANSLQGLYSCLELISFVPKLLDDFSNVHSVILHEINLGSVELSVSTAGLMPAFSKMPNFTPHARLLSVDDKRLRLYQS